MTVLFMISGIMNVSGQNEEETLLLEEDIVLEGPFWYSVSCLKISCPGLNLEINNNGDIYYLEDSHQLEWGGFLHEGAVVSLFSSSEVTINDIEINMIKSNNLSNIEHNDLIDSIPSPGNQENYHTIITEDHCFLGNCDDSIEEQRYIEFIGILENHSDKDSIQIFGEPGDVIVLSDIIGNNDLKIELWHRNNSIKELVTNDLNEPENLFEFPEESELWIRIVSSSSEGIHPYKFDLYRNNQSKESGNEGELQVPWNHGEPLSYATSWDYESYIAKSDQNGDSILFEIGADMKASMHCSTSNEGVTFESYLVDYFGNKENISSDNGLCPEIIETKGDTASLEIWIMSTETTRWNISFTPLRSLDGMIFSDAPESKWIDAPDERWNELQLDTETSGSLHSGDNIDIFLLKISDNNGSRVFLNEIIKSEVNYTIQEINQNNGALVNTSNGEVIVLPYGNHSLRIERRAAAEVEIYYTFKLEYLGEYQEPPIDDYEDLSWMFNDFYILIGVLMLSPLMIVLFWNRGIILQRGEGSIQMQLHEKKKLIRIRERISKQINENDNNDDIIDAALIQLGESPWSSINEIWGQPELRHMTEQIEICAWKISDKKKNLLIGLKTSNWDWEVASIRLNYPEGNKLSIIDVSPKYISKEDEIFLDTLSKNSQIFLRIMLDGKSANLALELSGLVGEIPLAATPNKIIEWN
tara:strand:- start:1253 stop:3349 length:2097 start_codon:yes stop_codon:yes gene_type:complete